jgi:lipopolysaccharide biosynthesis protein
MAKNKRIIAIHLPQFYPFPENDEWWGKGFTEWRNVTKCKPRFKGHYQPHLPADLGFYDLRLKECRLEQQRLAKAYGVDGFCYYHYWFNGHLLMEKPVEAHLADEEEDFPFMLCWANENWHRNWAGNYNATLIEQHYSEEDDIAHFKYLLPFFKDPRYIRINGKPVFALYRIDIIPDVTKMCETFQKCARKEGFELYICKVQHLNKCGLPKGLEASIDFPPFNMSKKMNSWRTHPLESFSRRILKKTVGNSIYSYSKYVEDKIVTGFFTEYKQFPTIMPSWDNACRRVGQPFTMFKGSTPELFGLWAEDVLSKFQPFSKDENLVFVNAWNEWAEGNHLEPDLKWGLGYLEALKRAVEKYNR